MISMALRASAVSLVMLSALAVPSGSQIAPQSCNGKEVGYDAPGGGTATGLGTSGWRARNNAIDNAWNEIKTSAGVPECGACPEIITCSSYGGGWWGNPIIGDPVWDPVLKLWKVSVSWESAFFAQRCDEC